MTPKVTFAYIVSGDLPGAPVKIGISQRPRHRFDNIRRAVPFETRFLGVTINGAAREHQMFDATADRIIKTDWRYPTPALFALVRKWIADGEWFVPAPDPQAHFLSSAVRDRIAALGAAPPSKYDCTAILRGRILESASHDPTLGLDWDGHERSSVFPQFSWPERVAA